MQTGIHCSRWLRRRSSTHLHCADLVLPGLLKVGLCTGAHGAFWMWAWFWALPAFFQFRHLGRKRPLCHVGTCGRETATCLPSHIFEGRVCSPSPLPGAPAPPDRGGVRGAGGGAAGGDGDAAGHRGRHAGGRPAGRPHGTGPQPPHCSTWPLERWSAAVGLKPT